MLPAIKLFDTVLSQNVWKDKYSNGGKDQSILQTMERVAGAVIKSSPDRPDDGRSDYLKYADMMVRGVLMPAGRIVAGAGTGNRVTLMNCYVMGTVPDSLDGILDELKRSSLTMQQGGGIGTDFSTLRPYLAELKRTGSYSSGPLPFMDMWDAMCATIMSAGHRRGAMMGTIRIDHPDIMSFIKAKRTKGRMTNFNISILVTDKFMEALNNDTPWHLHFSVPKKEWSDFEVAQRRYPLAAGGHTYIYETVMARTLWDEITKNTYEYSEPGVIFIDRINKTNNLGYLETISCTNPCGEQPLPPYGACDLGHVNLAMLVKDPFTPDACIDADELRQAAGDMVEFLDNVIDVTGYPLEEQQREQFNKRRIGVGITGLADALCAMGRRYGSQEAIQVTDTIMQHIANACYKRSVELAKLKGPFPLWSHDKFNYTFAGQLASDIRRDISRFGLRNGVLMTIAPTGTMSSFYGNVSGGCEPIFRHHQRRKVRQPDDSFKPYDTYSLTVRAMACFQEISDDAALRLVLKNPETYPTVENLTVDDHVMMQAACQKWVDASISKTVNVPKDMPYEEFRKVYTTAYALGCKGCTTFRENEEVRGSILSDVTPDPSQATTETESPRETERRGLTEARTLGASQQSTFVSPVQATTPSSGRPYKLSGMTYKIRWPHYQSAVYVTINEDETGQPREIFIASKNAHFAEWSTALSVMISRQLKEGVNPSDIARELKEITLAQEPAWIDGVLHRSIISMIGGVIEDYVKGDPLVSVEQELKADNPAYVFDPNKTYSVGSGKCSKCGSYKLVRQEGCDTCMDCGHSKCG
ncbi:MAG: adenosylcobalamin-dependent ribonucleoside-diphosphate reductase [Nitrospira sp.]